MPGVMVSTVVVRAIGAPLTRCQTIRRSQRRHIVRTTVGALQDTHAALFNQMQRSGGVAVTVDEFVSVEDHWFQFGKDHSSDRFSRQPRKRRHVAKKGCRRACLSCSSR